MRLPLAPMGRIERQRGFCFAKGQTDWGTVAMNKSKLYTQVQQSLREGPKGKYSNNYLGNYWYYVKHRIMEGTVRFKLKWIRQFEYLL